MTPLSGLLAEEADVPKSIELAAEPEGVRVKWIPPNGPSPDILVERYRASQWEVIGSARASEAEFLDGSAAAGESYCYRLRTAVDNRVLTPSKCVILAVQGSEDRQVQSPTTGRPDGRAEDLAAEVTAEGWVELKWVDGCSNEEAYVVERTGAGEGWAAVARLVAGATRYVDDQVAGGEAYCYRVAAVAGERSAYSKLVCAIAGPAPADSEVGDASAGLGGPSDLTVGNEPSGGVVLAWTDGAEGEARYEVARYTSGTGWELIASLPPGTQAHVDANAASGQTYCWRVTAVFGNGAVRRTGPKCLRVSPPAERPLRIRGYVRENGNPLPGITVALAQEDRTTVTAGDGSFELSVPSGWSGRIVPRHWSYTFTPSQLTFDNLLVDIEGGNFDAQPWSGIATATPDSKLLLPWLELTNRSLVVEDVWGNVEGSEGHATYGEYCMRGLRYWARVTDSAILTTHPGALGGTFEYVMPNKPPGMRIFGGISTYTLPGCTPDDTRPYDFADTAGWQFIATEARHIANATGNNVVVLENERALTPFHRDAKPIDLAKLERSLGALRETGIEFWWYLPSVQENATWFPDRQNESIRLINAISNALPTCRFIVGYAGYIDWRRNTRTEVTRRQIMINMLGQPRILDYIFVTRDGYWYWQDGAKRYCHNSQDAFAEIRGLTDANWVSVYPGGANWVTVAREFAEGYTPGP